MGISTGGGGGALSGVGTPGQQLVFEWNKLDGSQFDNASRYASGGSLGLISLSTDVTPEMAGGTRLVLNTGGVGEGISIILANDPLPDPPAGGIHDWLFEIEVSDVDQNGLGVVFFANPGATPATDMYCVGQTFVGTNRQFEVEAGTLSALGTIGSVIVGTNQRGFVANRYRLDRGVLDVPRGVSYARGYTTPTVAHLAMDQWPDQPFAAGWNGLTALRWGLCMYGGPGSPTLTHRLGSIKIYDRS